MQAGFPLHQLPSLARHGSLGGSLTRIALARANTVGKKLAWRPAMPVTHWVWVKP